MDKTVIVDIDGTVADISHRLQYIKTKPKDWNSFFNTCNEDKPVEEICQLVRTLYHNDYSIIFCTGRKESIRKETTYWLLENVFNYTDFRLLMRSNNDYRPDTIVKPELVQKAGLTPENVSFILEDRSGVVKRWRELGFICLQVNEGDF